MGKKRSLSLLGAALVFFGVFTPALTVPGVGELNYLLCGTGDGTILVALALLSIFLALKNKYQALWITGAACLGVVAFTYLNLHKRLSELNAVTAQAYHLAWGWAVLVAGIGTMMASAAFKE